MTGKGGAAVGAVTNTAVTARGRDQGRAAAELAERAERDARIEAAAARVAAAQDAIRANAERRALAVAAAQRAIAAAERAERDANAAADEQILAAVRAAPGRRADRRERSRSCCGCRCRGCGSSSNRRTHRRRRRRRAPTRGRGHGGRRPRVSQSQGRPLRLSHADIVRWHEHVLLTATCHVWMGAVGSDGYGRFQINNKYDGTRMLTPHQVAARLGFGPIPEGATLLHDCEVRLCCRYGTGHVRGRHAEREHAARGGPGPGGRPRPGRVDVRGKVGASRAIQAALRDAVDRSPDALAAVLAATGGR